ncbi:unnamed protein product [Symbiodinium necroappetens]|uniref:Uncharacterized protein n=1 Tax=Symbiodinium necroappetens TaxID=1628268 RepID=A0A812QTG9_9DINO|nr:unnamed protein product [Symbiodinium necroappetens]
MVFPPDRVNRKRAEAPEEGSVEFQRNCGMTFADLVYSSQEVAEFIHVMDNRIRALEETQEYADEDPAEKELAAFEALAELPTTRDYHSSCGGLLWLSIRTRNLSGVLAEGLCNGIVLLSLRQGTFSSGLVCLHL